jgi:hypothetical protein
MFGLQWSFFRVCCGYAASSCTSCRRAVLFHFSLPIMWSRWLGAAIVELQRPYSGEKCLVLWGQIHKIKIHLTLFLEKEHFPYNLD